MACRLGGANPFPEPTDLLLIGPRKDEIEILSKIRTFSGIEMYLQLL